MSSQLKGKHHLLTVNLQRSEALWLWAECWSWSPVVSDDLSWFTNHMVGRHQNPVPRGPSGTGLISISRTENNQNGLFTFHNLGFISKASGFPLKMQHLNVFFCTSMFYFTAWILVKPVIQNQFQGCIHLFIGEHQAKNKAWQSGEVLNCAKLQTWLAFCELQTHKIKSHFYV